MRVYLNNNIITMLLINLISSMVLSICYFLQLYFIAELHFKIAVAGMFLASYGFGTVLGGWIGGKLSDYYSPKNICALSLIMEGFLFFNLFHLQTIVPLIVNLFFLGFVAFSAITTNYVTTLAFSNDKNQRLTSISLLDISNNLGLGLAAIIIGWIPVKNMPALFLLGGMTSIITGFFLLANSQPIKVSPKTHLVECGNEREVKYNIYYTFLCLFIAGIIISQLSGTYAIYLANLSAIEFREYNLFGALFALNTFLVVFFQLPILNFIKRFDSITIATLGVVLLGLGMSILLLERIQWLIISCFVFTLGEILFFAVAQSILYENTPTAKKGSILGQYRMIYGFSRMIGPLAGNYLYQTYGSHFVWTFCGCLSLGILLIAVLSHLMKHSSLINTEILQRLTR